MAKILVRSVYDRNISGKCINVTTSGGVKGKQFSPMLLGPVEVFQGSGVPRLSAKNLENAWQFSKVYSEHDNDGQPNKKWYAWREKGFNDDWAHRYPMGKGKIPLYSWIGKPIDYIMARKLIYTVLYKKAIIDHRLELYSELIEMAKSEDQLTLLDYDVYPRDTGDNLTFDQILNNPNVKMGHAYVLANMINWDLDFKRMSNESK